MKELTQERVGQNLPKKELVKKESTKEPKKDLTKASFDKRKSRPEKKLTKERVD